ncbi:hypothetical protein O181_077628 [Austropuccinia psidii MF-1]|uniref:Integrase catalytic domain-containing protein n=1 Tax=Austropuccinia psidii MF-1 TaxID=1389203 RepID=A0A9Q3FHB3_9BASI|nr:hypothetical protein [Austropuccinia psidii MF-1]
MWYLKAAKGLPIDPLPLADHLCESCSFAKSTHKPFACESCDLVKAPGDVIVVDLVGPFPQLVQKHLYGLVIQDHFSSLVAFIPLWAKSEAVKEILGWLKTFTVLSGHQVKHLRSDNAVEFLSNLFKEGLRHLEITHETTVPYENHQNGNVERVIRTLSETARAIMLGKHVEVALWPWAFQHAAWVFNQILHANSDQTPWEIVTRMKPNISILRVFGCVAYVHDHLHKKNLKVKLRKLIHLGVAQDAKGWLFWDCNRRIFVKGALAIFEEAGMISESSGNVAMIKSIGITRIDDSSMIEEMTAQDDLFSIMSMNVNIGLGVPVSYKEALTSNNRKSWEAAMADELKSPEEMGVWQEVSTPAKGILGSRWVYTLKTNMAGEVVHFEAQAVVQGHRQIRKINFEEMFAPMPTFQSLQCILAMASAHH